MNVNWHPYQLLVALLGGMSFRVCWFSSIPGTVTSVKSPFFIITSAECPFIKPWVHPSFTVASWTKKMSSNDCYKTLSFWDKVDNKGEASGPTSPHLHFSCGNFKSLNKPCSLQARYSFSGVDCISHKVPNNFKRTELWEDFTNKNFLYLWLCLLSLNLTLLLQKDHLLYSLYSCSSSPLQTLWLE